MEHEDTELDHMDDDEDEDELVGLCADCDTASCPDTRGCVPHRAACRTTVGTCSPHAHAP